MFPFQNKIRDGRQWETVGRPSTLKMIIFYITNYILKQFKSGFFTVLSAVVSANGGRLRGGPNNIKCVRASSICWLCSCERYKVQTKKERTMYRLPAIYFTININYRI